MLTSFKSSFRFLLANKSISLLNISGLALGVATCMLIWVWLQREVSYDNFHPNKEEIYRLSNTFTSESETFSQAGSGPAFGAQLPNLVPEVRSACRVFHATYKLEYADKVFIEENAIEADSNLFTFFGFKLLKGDPKTALTAPDQIVLTESIAKKYFGDEDPVGKTMLMDGEHTMRVSGLAADIPVNSHLQFDVIVPAKFLLAQMMSQYQFDVNNAWFGGWPHTYLQIPGPDVTKATQSINAIAAEKSKKEWEDNKMSYTYFLTPVTDIHLKSSLRYDAPNNGSLARVKVFALAGLIVLLLACVNYINLTTAGALKRAKETGIKKVSGASQLQLVRQYLGETGMVCTIAVLAGIGMFQIALPFFSQWIGQEYRFDFTWAQLLVLAAATGILTLISGLYPAFVLSSAKLSAVLKGNASQRVSSNWMRKGLVVFQFTATIAILSAILIINRQMDFIEGKGLGYAGSTVITIPFYGERTVRDQYPVLRNIFMQSPYVLNVSKHNGNVVGGLGNGWTKTENLQGELISTSLYSFNVDTTYFDTYDMKLAAGRFFSSAMLTDTTKSVLVNEAAVRTFGWQTPENAIGKRFGEGDDIRHVIGVVRDFHFESLHKPVEAVLIGFATHGGTLSLKLDAAHLDAALEHIESVWKSRVDDLPFQYSFVDDQVAEQYGNEKRMQSIFYAFSMISLFIACLGLFGLSMFMAERKTKEIGIRKVLGATIPQILTMLSKDFLLLMLVALMIATPIAWYAMQGWLNGFAYRIDVHWWIFLLAGILAMVVALLTISVQTARAAVRNPVQSLRSE